jgi:hypothetical protein
MAKTLDTILDLKDTIANFPDGTLIAAEDIDGNEYVIIAAKTADDNGVLIFIIDGV